MGGGGSEVRSDWSLLLHEQLVGGGASIATNDVVCVLDFSLESHGGKTLPLRALPLRAGLEAAPPCAVGAAPGAAI